MHIVKKQVLLAVTASFALLASTSAFAGQCKPNEVCGLDLDVDINTDRAIEGTGGVDVSGVNVEGTGDITVKVPTQVDNAFEFSQNNIGDVNSNLKYQGEWIAGDFESSVASVGNNASISTTGSIGLEGVQNNSGDINASSNVKMTHLVGIKSININSTAVANNMSFTSTDDLVLDTIQNNTGDDVNASADVLLMGQQALTTADVNVEVAAVGNNLSASYDGNLVGSSVQENCADIDARANVTVLGMKDPVNVTAVGNNLSIKLPN